MQEACRAAAGSGCPVVGSFLGLLRRLRSKLPLVRVLVTRSSPTLCNPVDRARQAPLFKNSLARILEWVSIPVSRGSS